MSIPNLTRLRPARLGGLVAVCATFAMLVAMVAPSSANAARVQCTGTFRVLHDDHVGSLVLPRGNYGITILASGRPNCAQASALFTRFLEDFNGVLPVPWVLEPQTASFRRSASGPGFRIKPLG